MCVCVCFVVVVVLFCFFVGFFFFFFGGGDVLALFFRGRGDRVKVHKNILPPQGQVLTTLKLKILVNGQR